MLFDCAPLFLIVAMHEYVGVRLHFFNPGVVANRDDTIICAINKFLVSTNRNGSFQTTLNKSRGRDFFLRGVVL